MEQDSGFDQNVKIVMAWRFYEESLARLYQSKLKNAGIISFLSNHHASALIPFGDGGIILHVREEDLSQSLKIIRETYTEFQTRPLQDFSSADLEDIEYEKQLSLSEEKLLGAKSISTRGWILLIVLGLIISLLISYLISFK